MSKTTLVLTSAGLKNLISGVEQEEEFEFIFGKQIVSMKNVFAEFISPAVSKIHQTDPTINQLCFNDKLKDMNLSENSISKFQSISKGETVTINEEESFEMKIISILVDNEELFDKLSDLYSSEINETNIDLYLSNLTIFSNLSPLFNCFNCKNIIDTISSHFYSIDKKKLKQVPKDILYQIICNSNLRLESEDSLLDFLNDIFDEDKKSENICFYEEIEFSMLSEAKFDAFIENFDSSNMTQNLWLKLRNCFYTNKSKRINDVNESRYQTKKENNTSQVSYKIIEYLTKEVGGNVIDKGVLKVDSSSNAGDGYQAKNAADIYNKNNYFCSQHSLNSWLKYDFINKKVHPNGYEITTRYDHDDYHPRNWVIEGSNDDFNWDVLDNRTNEICLTGLSVTCTFDIKSQEGSYRYLRIRSTGKDSNDSDLLLFSSLDFIGTLLDY